MPTLPYVPNVFKVVFSGTIGAHNWAVILHCGWSGTTPSVAACNAFGADLEGAYASGTGMNRFPPASTILTAVELTDLSTSTGNSGGWAGSLAGANAGNEIGANTAMLCNFPSSFRYRGGHPRAYWPPGTQNALQDASHWTTTETGYAVTAMQLIQTQMNTATSGGTNLTGQCAVSYVNKALNPTPPYYRGTPIVMPISNGACTFPTEIASQRRRAGRK